MSVSDIDMLHYELLLLEQNTPYFTSYLHSFKHKNKFFETFILHRTKQISYLCSELLINEKGRCNWENIKELEKRGYYVGPGEEDGFGWVTGIVGTSKGDIVYG